MADGVDKLGYLGGFRFEVFGVEGSIKFTPDAKGFNAFGVDNVEVDEEVRVSRVEDEEVGLLGIFGEEDASFVEGSVGSGELIHNVFPIGGNT